MTRHLVTIIRENVNKLYAMIFLDSLTGSSPEENYFVYKWLEESNLGSQEKLKVLRNSLLEA